MKVILLDASAWRSPDDFYSALVPALGAPPWHRRNHALYDSLGGGINRLDPPFAIKVQRRAGLSSDMTVFLAKAAAVFEDAREELDANVSFSLC